MKKISQMSKKKKIILGVIAAIVVIAIIVFVVRSRSAQSPDEDMLIDDGSVSTDVGATNYYNGVIEPQETWDIKKDATREIAEVYVAEGDTVTNGQKLFSYKTDDVTMQIQQAKLELESIKNEVTDYQNQINELQNQKAQASEDQQLDYTLQIQELQTSQKQSALSQKTKQVEIDNLEKSIENAVVTSKMDGVVKKVATSSDSEVYMTILATGAYQVKATVDELNVGSLSEGMSVVIHSRVNEDQTWEGTITKIDTENAQTDNSESQMYYKDSSSTENQASKYYFYVALNTGDDLLLGQHVYIEPVYDMGEDTADVESEVE